MFRFQLLLDVATPPSGGTMPAVTVQDLTVLPRLTGPGLGDTVRPVVSVTTAPQGYEGEGFPVRRAFAGVDLAALDPFVHMDQMGEVEYAPGAPKGTPWHPHRGFETVTYMIDGVMDHRDSHGGGGASTNGDTQGVTARSGLLPNGTPPGGPGSITNGDTQWMPAGSGLLHIEPPPEWLVAAGGLFHGVQLWVNLPRAQKGAAPRYQALRSSQLGLVTTADAGALVRIIAGNVGGQTGPGSTHTPMAMAHASLAPGSRLELPWEVEFNSLVYVLAGFGTVGSERPPIPSGQLAVLGRGDFVSVAANERQDSRTPTMEVLVLGGRPIREPVAWGGPFVMNTRAEVMQAFEDFQKGRMGQIPAVHGLSNDPRDTVEG